MRFHTSVFTFFCTGIYLLNGKKIAHVDQDRCKQNNISTKPGNTEKPSCYLVKVLPDNAELLKKVKVSL